METTEITETGERSRASSTTTFARLIASFKRLGRTTTILQQLSTLAACFERPFPEAVQLMYLETLLNLTDDQVAYALERAQHEAKFFPPPGMLKSWARVEVREEREERHAREALAWLIQAIREHGVDGQPKRGRLLKEETRDTAAEYEWIPAPKLREDVGKTVKALGYGNFKTGMALIAEHPLVRYDAEAFESVGLRLSAIEKLEARWLAAWKKANR